MEILIQRKMKKLTFPLFCISCVSAFGAEQNTLTDDFSFDSYSPADYSAPVAESAGTETSAVVGIEAFYADSDAAFGNDSLNMGGVNLRYTVRQNSPEDFFQKLAPEFFIVGGLGFGYGDYGNDETFEFYHVIGMLGANLRCGFGEHFSLYAGARMGIDFFDFSADSGSGNDLGWIYGLGIGADIALSRTFSVTLSVEHLTSSAQPEAGALKLPEQRYIVYSFGMKFSF